MAGPREQRGSGFEAGDVADLSGDILAFNPKRFGNTVRLYLYHPEDLADLIAAREWRSIVRPFTFLCLAGTAVFLSMLASRGDAPTDVWSLTNPEIWNLLLTIVLPFILSQYAILLIGGLNTKDGRKGGAVTLLWIYTYWAAMLELFIIPIFLIPALGLPDSPVLALPALLYLLFGAYLVLASHDPLIARIFAARPMHRSAAQAVGLITAFVVFGLANGVFE